MKFSDVIGNAAAADALKGMVDEGRVPHALMFHEDDGCGAMAMTLAFLGYLFDDEHKISKLIHPDVHFVYPVNGGTSLTYVKEFRELVLGNPYFLENELGYALGIEGKNAIISVDEAKVILDKLSFTSLEGGYRAIVVYLPEKMNEATANRLLKSIEEPPSKTVFVFITHAPEKVLTTISSRCQRIRLLPIDRNAISGIAPEQDETMELACRLLDAVARKDLADALDASESAAALPSREKAKTFCKGMSEMLRAIFLCQQGLAGMVNLPGESRDKAASVAPKLRKSFSRNALPVLDNAQKLIDRNINVKVLFCDLANKLYTLA